VTLSKDDGRSLLHAATGLVALGLGVFPRWFVLVGAGLGVLAGWVVIPMTPLEAKLRRPGEPFFCGLRTYPLAVLGLVVLLPPTLAAIAWAIFAFGDAAASVVGRRFAAPHVFGHPKATWSGSPAFFVVGTLVGVAFGQVVAATGGSPSPSVLRIVLASLAATLIDLVPIPPDDNLPHAAASGLVLALANFV
jgi:dolichol kinase